MDENQESRLKSLNGFFLNLRGKDMNAVSGFAQGLFQTTVHVLNQNKEKIKTITGIFTFVFGLIALQNLYRISQGERVMTGYYASDSYWKQRFSEVSMVCAKFSLVFSAVASVQRIPLVRHVFSAPPLEAVFGPNTTFALNPWHPRHVASIVAVALAAPSLIESSCHGMYWIYKKIQKQNCLTIDVGRHHIWLTDSRVRPMVWFNTFISSRVTQHLVNRFAQAMLHYF